MECLLDCSTFGVDLHVYEHDFLHACRRDTGKAPDRQEKEEMKLEKKLREICALRQRQVDGEKLEKLQAEKISRKDDVFRQVAEMKLRKAEKELLKVFRRYVQRFQDSFWELESKTFGSDQAKNDAGDINLIATSRLVLNCTARQTVPIPPSPNRPVTR